MRIYSKDDNFFQNKFVSSSWPNKRIENMENTLETLMRYSDIYPYGFDGLLPSLKGAKGGPVQNKFAPMI